MCIVCVSWRTAEEPGYRTNFIRGFTKVTVFENVIQYNSKDECPAHFLMFNFTQALEPSVSWVFRNASNLVVLPSGVCVRPGRCSWGGAASGGQRPAGLHTWTDTRCKCPGSSWWPQGSSIQLAAPPPDSLYTIPTVRAPPDSLYTVPAAGGGVSPMARAASWASSILPADLHAHWTTTPRWRLALSGAQWAGGEGDLVRPPAGQV